LNVLADEEGKLVGILARCGDTDCAAPVVVEVAQLEREALQYLWGHAHLVLDHVEVCWCDCSLRDRLADQEEVVPVTVHDCLIAHGAGRRVGERSRGGTTREQPCMDALLHDDEDQPWYRQLVCFSKALLELRDLLAQYILELSVADTVAVDNQSPTSVGGRSSSGTRR